jgi:hypothetical protein
MPGAKRLWSARYKRQCGRSICTQRPRMTWDQVDTKWVESTLAPQLYEQLELTTFSPKAMKPCENDFTCLCISPIGKAGLTPTTVVAGTRLGLR